MPFVLPQKLAEHALPTPESRLGGAAQDRALRRTS
jgi:hypothetical protein